jgi:hypothetical protein
MIFQYFSQICHNLKDSFQVDKNNDNLKRQATYIYDKTSKGKVTPLQARCGPEGGQNKIHC